MVNWFRSVFAAEGNHWERSISAVGRNYEEAAALGEEGHPVQESLRGTKEKVALGNCFTWRFSSGNSG